MAKSGFKYELYQQFAQVGKAASNANRLEILEFLSQCDRNVEQLARLCNLTIANTSQHLQILRQVGLVSSQKVGLHVIYSISSPEVMVLFGLIREIAESHLSKVNDLVDTYLTIKDNLEPIPRTELLQRVNDNLVTVLDVRPPEEYADGHVMGAINIPITDLEKHLEMFNPQQEVVAYCRGPHCILAFDAVATLRKHGFKARRLEDGYPEWKLAGLPVQ